MATLATMTVDLNMDSSGVAEGARAASASVERMTTNIRRTTDRGMQEVAHNMDGRLRDLRGNLVRSGRQRGMDFARSMVGGISRGMRNAGSAFTSALTGSLEQVQSAMSSNPYTASIGVALAGGIVASALPAIGALLSTAVISVGGLAVVGVGYALTKDMPEVQKSLKSLKKKTKSIFKDAGKLLANDFAAAFGDIEDMVTRLKPQIKSLFEAAQPLIKPLTDGITGLVENAMPGFVDMIKNAQPVFEGLSQFLSDVGEGLSGFFKEIGKSAPEAKTFLKDLGKFLKYTFIAAGWVIGKLAKLYGYVHRFIKNTIDAFKYLYDVLVGHSIIPDLIKAIIHWFVGLPGWILGKLKGFISKVIAKFAVMAVRVKNKVVDLIHDVVRWFRSAPGKAAHALRSLASKIAGKAYDAGRRLVRAIKDKIGEAVRFIKGLPDRAKRALSNLGSKLYGSGKALIRGFIDGIKNMIGRAKRAASRVVSAVRDFFPFSPAKEGPFSGQGWTLYSGRSLIDGFSDGVASRAPSLRKQIRSVLGDVPDTAMDISPRGVFRAKQENRTNVVFDVTGADNDMKRMIRKMVRIDGHGSVSRAFG